MLVQVQSEIPEVEEAVVVPESVDVRLLLGRTAVVVPIAGTDIEQLTSEERSFYLGHVGAQGFVIFTMTVPPHLPRGFVFYAQARIQRGPLEMRTNSTPLVVR